MKTDRLIQLAVRVDCLFGPTGRGGLLVRSNSPNGRVGVLVRSNSPSWRVGLIFRSNSSPGGVGRASSSARGRAGLIKAYARFVVSTLRIRLSVDSSNLSVFPLFFLTIISFFLKRDIFGKL